MNHINIYLLGQPRLVHRGAECKLRPCKHTALLAVLLWQSERTLYPRRSLLKDVFGVADAENDDDLDAEDKKHLHEAHLQLRHAINQLRNWAADHGLPPCVETVDDDVQLLWTDVPGVWVDIHAWRSKLVEWHTLPNSAWFDDDHTLHLLSEAHAAYNQPLLSNFRHKDHFGLAAWLADAQSKLNREAAWVLQHLMRCQCQRGALDEAATLGTRWLAHRVGETDTASKLGSLPYLHYYLMRIDQWRGLPNQVAAHYDAFRAAAAMSGVASDVDLAAQHVYTARHTQPPLPAAEQMSAVFQELRIPQNMLHIVPFAV